MIKISIDLPVVTVHGSSIGSVSAWHASGPEFDPHVRHILLWRFGNGKISMAILPLPLIQEEQLSVTGERMCTKYCMPVCKLVSCLKLCNHNGRVLLLIEIASGFCSLLQLPCNMSRRMTKPTKWCAPSKASDQLGHLPSLIRVFAVRMKKAWVLVKCTAKTDQTGWMPRLICVFAGCTCHFIVVKRRLI